MVQDYFLSETAEMADLVLPASLPFETGGSYTNTQKMIQQFSAGLKSKLDKTSTEQIAMLSEELCDDKLNISADVNVLNDNMLPEMRSFAKPYQLRFFTKRTLPMFSHAADSVMKRFDDEFETSFLNA